MNDVAFVDRAEVQEMAADYERQLAERDAALETALVENLSLRQVLAPFALFAQPAALTIAGGNDDLIMATVVKHEHQSLSWGAFKMAREVWDELEPLSDTSVKGTEE